jgi:hypothetical protein
VLRKILALIALLVAAPALAQTPVDQLAKPPADAKVWSITDPGGTRHGQVSLWTDASGTHWSRFSLNLRGFVSEIDEQNRFAPDGTLESMIVRGSTPSGDAAETYTVKDGVYSYTSPVDHGTGARETQSRICRVRRHLRFLPLHHRRDAEIADAFRRSAALGPGKDRAAHHARCQQRHGEETLTAYAITGFGLSPFPSGWTATNSSAWRRTLFPRAGRKSAPR